MSTHKSILCLLAILTSCYCDNLLKNGEFQDNTSWKLQVREDLWDLHPAVENQINIGKCDDCEDNRALNLVDLDNKRALVASQYIPEERIYNSKFGKLARLKVESRNLKIKGSYQLLLDISYEDSKYLFVNHQIISARTQSTCILIPQYGVIRAILVHVVVGDKLENPISIDSISVETLHDVKPYTECKAYTKSQPKEREILFDYLHPAVPLLSNNITLVTQLTEDRLELLEETARFWRGSITAALLVFQENRNETLKKIGKLYKASKYLSKFAVIHIIIEDINMNEDSIKYPVNYLRKFAMNATTTEYLFYVDADISPTFSHDAAVKWLQEEAGHLNHERSAFIVPLFHSKEQNPPLPETKSELLNVIKESKLEAFSMASHSIVQYYTWYKSDHIYEVKYRLNSEPYFITHREAPVINEMFEGYGRDKCAYSKELHHAGFSFYVLPHAFLINRKEPTRSKTILRRSSIHLRIFLTTMFHDEDLKLGFFRKRDEPMVPKKSSISEYCDAVTGKCEPEERESLYTEEININMDNFLDTIKKDDEDDGGISCKNLRHTTVDGELNAHQVNPMPNLQMHAERVAMTVGSAIKFFAIGNFIYLPKHIDAKISLMISYYHPSNVVNVLPNTLKITGEKEKTGLFTEYKSFINSTSTLLTKVRKNIADPSIYWIEMSGLKVHEAAGNLSAVLEYSSNDDVIIINENVLKPIALMNEMCRKKKSWKLYRDNPYYLMKSSHFKPPHPVTFARLDLSKLTIKNGIIDISECPKLKTDVILFTKNRPLQSHAFIESLLQMVSGINKLWIIAHSDQDEVTKGYNQLVNCFSGNLRIELLHDNDEGFGRVFDEIMHKSEADYIMMNVDEIVWLRPVDLVTATCLLDKLGDQVTSFQLRLGDNIRFGSKFIENQKQLIGDVGDEEINAFYPLWQPYDYGYVTQVDGPLISKERLHKEIGPWVYDTKHPGEVESRWLRRHLHKYARSWHLMYGKSRLVNNKVGDRVTGSGPSEPNRKFVDVYLKQQKAIDIEMFRSEHLNHRHTHIDVAVQYKDIKCL